MLGANEYIEKKNQILNRIKIMILKKCPENHFFNNKA
jgi:hypothetical protein